MNTDEIEKLLPGVKIIKAPDAKGMVDFQRKLASGRSFDERVKIAAEEMKISEECFRQILKDNFQIAGSYIEPIDILSAIRIIKQLISNPDPNVFRNLSVRTNIRVGVIKNSDNNDEIVFLYYLLALGKIALYISALEKWINDKSKHLLEKIHPSAIYEGEFKSVVTELKKVKKNPLLKEPYLGYIKEIMEYADNINKDLFNLLLLQETRKLPRGKEFCNLLPKPVELKDLNPKCISAVDMLYKSWPRFTKKFRWGVKHTYPGTFHAVMSRLIKAETGDKKPSWVETFKRKIINIGINEGNIMIIKKPKGFRFIIRDLENCKSGNNPPAPSFSAR